MWSLLVGAIMPTVVAIAQQPRWLPWQRAVIGVVASILAGVITTWIVAGHALFEQPMVTSILLIAVASWSSYKNFWKPTGVAPTIEAKTTVLS
jgi:high-affinity Fe2+/Pb2+ permease